MNERVIHYTSLEACKSIITNNEFWLTNCEHTNDLLELGVVNKDICSKLSPNLSDRPLISELLEMMDRAFSQSKGSIYLLSFCRKPDPDDPIAQDGLLSMWNRYARNEVAIEFDKTRLASILKNEFSKEPAISSVRLQSVEYGVGGKWEDEYVTEFKKINSELLNCKSWNEIFAILTRREVFEPYIRMRLLTKHIGFSEEKENRVLIVDDRDRPNYPPKFKLNSKGKQVKYVVVQNICFRDCIDRILIGPSDRQEYIEQELKKLKKDGLISDSVEIAKSEIPYRE